MNLKGSISGELKCSDIIGKSLFLRNAELFLQFSLSLNPFFIHMLHARHYTFECRYMIVSFRWGNQNSILVILEKIIDIDILISFVLNFLLFFGLDNLLLSLSEKFCFIVDVCWDVPVWLACSDRF